jgi:antitoxin component YwqK of YwqJK toxin-antitoxin module
MLFVFAFTSTVVLAQSNGAPIQNLKPANKAAFALSAFIVEKLPAGIIEQVSNWEKVDLKGRNITGWYANGQKAISFSQKGNHLHGLWQAWYENGAKKEEGHFTNGYPDGTWQFWYPSGLLKSERSFSASKLQAINIASRQRNPKLQFVPHTGNEPSSKETAPLSQSYFALPHSAFHMDLPFHKAVHEGVYRNFAENGMVIEQGNFANGLRDGQWLYHNQQLKQTLSGYYSYGTKNGPWKELVGDRLVTLEEYKNGMLIHRKCYSY